MAVLLGSYLALNFLCALALHWHGIRQPHVPVRALEVVVHFVLLTAFAIPVLMAVAGVALFGGGRNEMRPAESPAAESPEPDRPTA